MDEIRNLFVTYEKFNLEHAIIVIIEQEREMLCLKKVFDLLDKLKENGANFIENFDEMVITQLKEKRLFIYIALDKEELKEFKEKYNNEDLDNVLLIRAEALKVLEA